jgi:DNA mismatch repair protein MutS
MRQYHSIKQQVPQALLMFRLGDFYELFYEDAVTAARELEITLTSRNKEKDQAIPMCGVPHHAAEGYIARLIQKGYRVAICEQMEEPSAAKKIVRREITRIVTPGTATESALLRSHENNYLASAVFHGDRAGLAHVDVSTGEFRVTEVDRDEVGPALENLNAREVLLAPGQQVSARVLRTELEGWVFGFEYAERTLREHFKLLSLDGCGLDDKPLAVGAAGAILHYLRDTQRAALDHVERPTFYDRAEAMVLDGVTVRNLELVEPLFQGESKESTLLAVIDKTLTGMGGRLLRRRVLRPSLDRAEIESRLDRLERLLRATIERSEIRKILSTILDIERLLAKATLGTAGPRELLALGRSLDKIPTLNQVAQPFLAQIVDEVAEVRDRILNGISAEPPLNLVDGGTIRDGCHAELDELRDISRNGKQYIAQIEQRERTRTGVGSLKVRFNNVFGYYIEISCRCSILKSAIRSASPSTGRRGAPA